MSSYILNIISLFAILWHSIGGCCLHHAHAHSGELPQGLEATEQNHPTVCNHHHRGELKHSHSSGQPDRSETPEPADHEDLCCEEGNCVYNKTPSNELVVQTISPFFCSVESAVVHAISNLKLLRTLDRDFLAVHAETSVYRCALTQSWQL
ncbi:MAG TPA: hypothetical protein VLA12_10410 [Planctomycetaceae bacterium]|nr:hypothetical protein [Planctomycetaceae bacterium]